MTLRERLVRIRRILGISQKELADRIGVRQTMIAAIESGQDLLFRADVSRALDGLDPAVHAATGDPPVLVLARKTPVFGATERDEGTIMLSVEPIGFLERPAPLAEADDGYGIVVATPAMAPTLRVGEIALARPGVRPKVEDTCVFRGNGHLAALAEFQGESPEHWWVRQYLPDESVYGLARIEWPVCDVVVGKHLRR